MRLLPGRAGAPLPPRADPRRRLSTAAAPHPGRAARAPRGLDRRAGRRRARARRAAGTPPRASARAPERARAARRARGLAGRARGAPPRQRRPARACARRPAPGQRPAGPRARLSGERGPGARGSGARLVRGAAQRGRGRPRRARARRARPLHRGLRPPARVARRFRGRAPSSPIRGMLHTTAEAVPPLRPCFGGRRPAGEAKAHPCTRGALARRQIGEPEAAKSGAGRRPARARPAPREQRARGRAGRGAVRTEPCRARAAAVDVRACCASPRVPAVEAVAPGVRPCRAARPHRTPRAA